jgi:hypothetical protein
MSKPAAADFATSVTQERSAPTPEEIQSQLQRLLASPAFHGSTRCQQFLEYVCEKALSGESGALKERTIAIEVFGRSPQSELGEDTIVRVGAREVRKRLAQYYVTGEGTTAEIRIDLPSGAYSPEFRYNRAIPEPEPAPAPPAVLVLPPPMRRTRRGILAGVCFLVAALALLAAVRLSSANPNVEMFQNFWAPVVQSPEPLLLAVAHPIVYHPSRRALRWSAENQAPGTLGQEPLQVAPNRLDGSDMIPVQNQYVGYGDMVVANEVTAMLARQNRSVRLRMASGVEFADMRKSPTLLIGAVTNRWTMELQAAWRFRFVRTAEMRPAIQDTQTGEQWSVTSKEDGSSPDDYILASRIRNSVTGGMLMVAAGLKQFGTEAAGHLLTDPEQLGIILRKLPKGWESKNLQVVLHSRVIGNTPAQPEVVAAHVW